MEYDVIVIGGGPAGLTASLYTGRAGLKTLVIESYTLPTQAILTDIIENYPGFPEGVNGFQLIEKFKNQSKRFGAEFISGEVKELVEVGDKYEVKLKDKSYKACSVIVAVGARPKKINIPGEDRLIGKGVSYCATCDGALYKDKEVVVIGGGDTALEEAIFLTRFVKKVRLVHRRDKLRGVKVLQDRVFSNDKIEVIWDSKPLQIIGEKKVKSLTITNVKTNKETNINCDGIFIFVGYEPNTAFLKGFLDMDESLYILTDSSMKTNKKGIFACGDCIKKDLRQVVTACGEGALAAHEVSRYIENEKSKIKDQNVQPEADAP